MKPKRRGPARGMTREKMMNDEARKNDEILMTNCLRHKSGKLAEVAHPHPNVDSPET
jgi:hypothetical protein